MGENARYKGHTIKIGTCEDLWYLRADQAAMVDPLPRNVDPVREAPDIRFRFPWPDEDGIAPGAFEDPDRRMPLWGLQAPTDLAASHHTVQFTAPQQGYLTSLPCPESGTTPEGIRVGRNGFRGAVFLCQQRLIDGCLVPVLACACDMKWRVSSPEDVAPILDALRREHERYCASVHPDGPNGRTLPYSAQTHYTKIMRRIEQGFDRDFVASLLSRK